MVFCRCIGKEPRIVCRPMTPTLVLSLALLLAVAAVIFLLCRPKDKTSELLLSQAVDHLKQNVDSSSRLVHQQLSQLNKEMGDRLQEVNRDVGTRLDTAAKVFGEVQSRLGKMEEATQRIFEVGKDISKLQEIFRAPKLRGALGEMFLGDLLAQVLPQGAFELQYGFKNGEKVDAVIRSAQGLIAVDSKFPLENFIRILESTVEEEKKALRKAFLQDVKKHIDAIATKYIRPDEGTLDLALMYVPAENVYYEILLKDDGADRDLLRYAQEKRVFPVSPNSFYAYLQTIAIGLREMKIAQGVREVLNDIAGLRREFERFGEDFRKVGSHLSNARGSFEAADKRLQRLNDKLETIGLEEGPTELRVLTGGEEA